MRESVPRDVERVVQQRVPVGEGDSGEIETLPDGSISIPVFEEELVVTRRPVLKERVIIRKETVTEHERVKAQLRRERVVVENDENVDASALRRPVGPAETRPFLLTSEFLTLAAVVAGLAVTAAASAAFGARHMWELIAVVVAAYLVSRGFAKNRTPHR